MWHAALEGDRSRWVDGPITDASVLIALTRRGGLLLTERSAAMRHHAGQVALPGGRIEPTDRDGVEAAFREAYEEIGLEGRRLCPLGSLPSYLTGSGYRVQPVVALVKEELDLHRDLQPDPNEVASIFEVPLSFIFDPSNHRRHYWHAPEGLRPFYSMPWICDRSDAMRFSDTEALTRVCQHSLSREFFIWGATAAMLRNFYHLLYAHRDLFPIEA
jgi:8-oxo-dGTP pyrophosphatase MutT (NUDIX family)